MRKPVPGRSSSLRRLVVSAGLVLAAASAPRSAKAFSDYELFGLAPLEGGGGGGRYFTTSPLDGYGCGVCHMGGIKPIVQLRGLPEREYVPGAAYDVELVWQFPQVPHSLTLEIVNSAGQPAGTLTLPEILEAADRCTDPEMPGEPAARLVEEALPRRVLWLSQCGASRLRFRFVAPPDPELAFAMSMVRTDRSEKPEGDGVLEIRRVLSRQGLAKQATACALSHAAAKPVYDLNLSLVLMLGLVWVARMNRRKLSR